MPEPPADLAKIDLASFGLDPIVGYSPTALRKALDDIIPTLYEHLYSEIGTLSPDYCEKIGEATLGKVHAKMQAHLQQYDPKWFLCSAYG